MKASDLSPGNIVNYGNKVIEVSSKDLQWMEQLDMEGDKSLGLYKPLQLNDDIVKELNLDFGPNYKIEKTLFGTEYNIRRKIDDKNSLSIAYISYAHELQNLHKLLS